MSFDPGITDGFLFTWNIENADVVYFYEKITSPNFVASNLESSEWKIEIFQNCLHLIRMDSKKEKEAPEIVVHLVVSSNGINAWCKETKDDKGFHFNMTDTLLLCKTLTIHCHMRKPKAKNAPLIQFSVLTRIQVERRVGIWKVENFKQLTKYTPIYYSLESAGKQILSIVLSGETCEKNPRREKLLQAIWRRKQRLHFRESAGIMLPTTLSSGEDFKIKVNVNDYARYKRIILYGKICVLADDSEIKLSTERKFFFKSGSMLPASENDLFSEEIVIRVEDIYLSDGDLSLICDFVISTGEIHHEIKESNYLPNEYKLLNNFLLLNSPRKDKRSLFVQHFRMKYKTIANLERSNELQRPIEAPEDDRNYKYLDKKYCDVVLSTRNKKFPVHKCILSLKSPVFKTMFETDMKESSSRKVAIDDLDSDTLNRFLLFLYTENLEDLRWGVAVKLLYAADKYQVTSLKTKCSSFLKSYLSMSNVCEALQLAYLHGDEDLKLACNDFILQQNAAEIFSSEEWKAFTVRNPVLFSEILQKYFLMKN